MNFLTTIRGRVILLVLLLLVPASLLIFLTARDSRELQLSQARNQLLAVAWHANSALASDIRDLQLTTEMLNYVSAVRDATEPECSRVLAALLENKRYLGGVVLDENGNSRCNGIDGNKNPKNYADRDYFPKTMQSGVSVVAKPIIGRLSGRMVLPVTAPVKNADGKTVGLVVTALDLAQFGARFVQEQQVPGSVFLIWDRDGDLLYRYPDAEKLSGQRFPELQLVKAASAQGGKGTLELAGFDGLPRVFGFAALEEYKDAGVYVGVGVPAKELYASANALVWNALWATLVMGLIGVGAAWIIGRTMIWQPIKKLSNATTRMAAGDFSARLGAPYGRSELGELAQVFDQMAQASERGRNAMQDINNTLEQRVIERTAGLEASEQKFRNVLESAADAIVIVDRQGTVVIANASAETLFGYTRAELLGHSVDRLLPASFQVAHRRQREAYADSPEGRSMGERGAVKGLRKDATEFIASISLSPVQTPEGLWITAVVRDISDFIAAEVELKRLNRTLRVLSQCNHVLVGATDESELLDAICRMVVEIGGYRLAWVGFALHDEGATVLPVAQFGAHEGYVENLHITYADTERGRCPSGIAIREAHTVIAHSMQTSSYFIPGRDLALARGFSSCVAKKTPSAPKR
jgi:PAS domain S-box-containing protein